MDGEFLKSLRDVMRTWHWTEPQIEDALPKILKACTRVGLVVWKDGDPVETDLVEDDAAWERVWAELEKEGIGESFAE